jgi:hypothetical protein
MKTWPVEIVDLRAGRGTIVLLQEEKRANNKLFNIVYEYYVILLQILTGNWTFQIEFVQNTITRLFPRSEKKTVVGQAQETLACLTSVRAVEIYKLNISCGGRFQR